MKILHLNYHHRPALHICMALGAVGLWSSVAMANPVFPASDPTNHGHWRLLEGMSDEFEGIELDQDKWLIQGVNGEFRSNFRGRAPSQFSTNNVRVEAGMLKLETRWEPDYPFNPAVDTDGNTYENITTAAVITRQQYLYGYMEIKCKAANADVTSAFWTTGQESELDVFESTGNPSDPGQQHLRNEMWSSIHDWSRPRPNDVWTEKHYLPFDFADGFHVYGCEWDRDGIRFYADGELVTSVTRAELGTDWVMDAPQWVWVDSETFPWRGIPVEADLPVDYEIEYIRVWQKHPPPTVARHDFASTNFVAGPLDGQRGWAGGVHTIVSEGLALSETDNWITSRQSVGLDALTYQEFSMSAVFRFSEKGGYQNQGQFINVVLDDEVEGGNQFRLSLHRQNEDTYVIWTWDGLGGSAGYTSFSAGLIGLDVGANADLDSDLLQLSLSVEKGASPDDWTFRSELRNLDSGSPAATATGALPMGAAVFDSPLLYGVINGGEVAAPFRPLAAENRIVYRARITSGPETGWVLFADTHDLSGSKSGHADTDGLSDWGEYAFGGNPTNPSDRGQHPELRPNGDYVFHLMGDPVIVAHVLTTDDLVAGNWSTNDTTHVCETNGVLNRYTNSALNALDMNPVFIGLEVE